MNKLILVVALVAVIGSVGNAGPVDEYADVESQALASVESQAQEKEEEKNRLEVMNLPKEDEVYIDFCVKNRIFVRDYITKKTSQHASDAFKWIMDLFRQAASVVGQESSKAVDEGAVVIQNDSVKQVAAVLKMITDAFFRAVRTEAGNVLEQVKSGATTETLFEGINTACRDFRRYVKSPMEENFDKHVKNNGLVVPKNKVKQLQCRTVKRVMLVARACDFYGALMPMMREMAGNL
jgi:hypothetical protein